MLKKLYDKSLTWAKHKHANKYLCALSFAESSFFPIPPEVMLVPMSLATPKKAFSLAFFTTVFSVLGGMFGYAIGFFAFDLIAPWLQTTHYWSSYQITEYWFTEWGFWAIFIAGFSPLPYKVFTLAAGVAQMVFLPFVIASLLGRGIRFFLVSWLSAAVKTKLESLLEQHLAILAWTIAALALVGGLIYIM